MPLNRTSAEGVPREQLKNDFGHKLDELVTEAIKKDLHLTMKTQEEIKLLNEAHTKFQHRYPDNPGPVFIIEQFIPATSELLSEVRTAIYGGPLDE